MRDAGPLTLLIAPPFGWLFAGLFGALWGSFFNVAIHRLGREDARLRDLVRPPSHCPRCLHPIRARDNVPIVGWLLLRGRCRDCHAPISIRYPLVELLGCLLGLAVYQALVLGHAEATAAMYGRFFVYFFFAGTLLVLAFIDLDTMLLPEAITLPGIPAFFVLGRAVGDVPLRDVLIGAAVGFGALKALQLGYAALTGRDGLGSGDATLLALIGGFLGWRALPFTLGLGATLGTLITVPLLVVRRRRARLVGNATRHVDDAVQQTPAAGDTTEVPLRHVEVPFGPFLVAGALLYLFLKEPAWAALLGWADRP